MYNKDYNKEVGLDNGQKILPLRYLIPLLAVIAALCWFGARSLNRDEGTSPTPASMNVSTQS